MKQPELGRKLNELRQLRGVTQQEIAEKCNVSMRTIQRIELGKTEPRPMTMKLILDFLDDDYESFMGGPVEISKPVSGTYITGAIAGVIYFVLGFAEAYVDFGAMTGYLSSSELLMYVMVKVFVVVAFTFFIRGFWILGKRLGSRPLEFSALILMVVSGCFYGTWIGLVAAGEDATFLIIGESITMGTVCLLFAYGLYSLKKQFGGIAVGAAGVEALIGISLVLVIPAVLGLLLTIPATLVEIYLLYSASAKTEAELSFS